MSETAHHLRLEYRDVLCRHGLVPPEKWRDASGALHLERIPLAQIHALATPERLRQGAVDLIPTELQVQK